MLLADAPIGAPTAGPEAALAAGAAPGAAPAASPEQASITNVVEASTGEMASATRLVLGGVSPCVPTHKGLLLTLHNIEKALLRTRAGADAAPAA